MVKTLYSILHRSLDLTLESILIVNTIFSDILPETPFYDIKIIVTITKIKLQRVLFNSP